MVSRVAIVTGSATGTGAAIARHFAARGWGVVVNCRRSIAEAEETVRACRELGGEAFLVDGDVGEDATARALVAAAIERWGRLDAVVNNAGVTKHARFEDLDALDAEDFQRIYRVNVVGAYQLARAAAPQLRRSELAAVVNVSSHSGFSGFGSSIAYAASKGALNTLTLSLARALAPEIRVNAVCPGFVDTRWMRGSLDEAAYAHFKEKVASIAPLKRMVEVDDVADAVDFLVTQARRVTGQLLVIDGGTHLMVATPRDAMT